MLLLFGKFGHPKPTGILVLSAVNTSQAKDETQTRKPSLIYSIYSHPFGIDIFMFCFVLFCFVFHMKPSFHCGMDLKLIIQVKRAQKYCFWMDISNLFCYIVKQIALWWINFNFDNVIISVCFATPSPWESSFLATWRADIPLSVTEALPYGYLLMWNRVYVKLYYPAKTGPVTINLV